MLDLAAAAGFIGTASSSGAASFFLAAALGFLTLIGVLLLIQLLALSRVKASNFLSTSQTYKNKCTIILVEIFVTPKALLFYLYIYHLPKSF